MSDWKSNWKLSLPVIGGSTSFFPFQNIQRWKHLTLESADYNIDTDHMFLSLLLEALYQYILIKKIIENYTMGYVKIGEKKL